MATTTTTTSSAAAAAAPAAAAPPSPLLPLLLPDIAVTPAESKAFRGAVVAVTGAGGFVASHLVARLLAAGATVRACVRSEASAAHLRELELRYGVNGKTNKKQLELFTGCDLLVPGSFDAALGNGNGSNANNNGNNNGSNNNNNNNAVKYVFHTASPFQMAGKGQDLLDAAVGGTREVLEACARVCGDALERVVLTSSVAALHAWVPRDRAGEERGKAAPYGPKDWNTEATTSFFPYEHSKAAAERWAWRFVHAASGGEADVPPGALEGGEGGGDESNTANKKHNTKKIRWSLSVVNPSFVLGPPLASRTDGESVGIACKLLQDAMLGAYPDVHFGACDVRDVATVHSLAAITPTAAGKRLIVAPHRSSFGALVEAVRADPELLPRVRLPRRAAFYPVLLALSPLLAFVGMPPYRVRLTYGVPGAVYDCSEAEGLLREAGAGAGGGGSGSKGDKGGEGGGAVWTPRDVTVTDMARALLARGLVRDRAAAAAATSA